MKVISHSIYLATTLGLLFVQAACAQYVTLTAGPGKATSQTLTVASGELATVVHLSTSYYREWGYLEVASGGVTNKYLTSETSGAAGANASFHYNLPVIAGPATIRVVAISTTSGTYPHLATIQITKPTSTFVPVNTVVIPNDNGAPVNIIMESSTDMVKWNAANPGTYGTSTTNRFFRVRAER